MLKSKRIPTPLVDPATVPPVNIKPMITVGRGSSVRLFFRLVGFMFSLFWDNLRRRPPEQTAQKVRDFIEDLGGLWIKAGQLISLRIDVLPPAMADQLAKLQYQSCGFDPQAARACVEASLGRTIESVFDVYEEHPFAAASISQLHRAHVRGGGWVAVKVQRPGIHALLERDLRLIRFLLRLAGRAPTVSYITWDGLSRELEHMMREEVDYRYEAANMRRMRKMLKDHKVVVPKVYRKLCSKNVIVMEYIPGVVMSDYMRMKRTNPGKLALWEIENNVKPRKVGSRLMRTFYRQLFEEDIFHGDLHPGNILLLRDSRIALIDFGTVGSLEAKFIRIYTQQARAFAEGDYTKGLDYYLLLCDSVPPVDLATYRAESVEVARAWEQRTHMDGLPYIERSWTGGLATDLADVNRRFKVNPSWQLLRVGRSLSTLDANLGILLENENPNRVFRKYFKEAQQRAVRRFIKTGISTLVRTIADSADTASYFGEQLRRQSIQIKGAQSKLMQILELVTSITRIAIVVAGIVLLYDFLHQHNFSLIQGINNDVGALREIAEAIPAYDADYSIVILVVILITLFALTRAKRIFGRNPVRLPSGRVEE